MFNKDMIVGCMSSYIINSVCFCKIKGLIACKQLDMDSSTFASCSVYHCRSVIDVVR